MDNIALNEMGRFLKKTTVDKQKLDNAMKRAVDRLRKNLVAFNGGFPATCTKDYKYEVSEQFNWESGMLTGCSLLAYKYTGDEFFKKEAEKHIDIYKAHSKTGEWLEDHDVGFIFLPSCVAGYKITGDLSMRDAALDAAKILLSHYDWDNHFIIRSGVRDISNYNMYRTLVDSMMNIPLFFWAYNQTGDKTYYDAAVGHYHTTIKYLIREDGSSFHHYQFDPVTGKPVGGVTLQGNSNESCWARGHSWLIYGFPIAYSYTNDEEIIEVHKNLSYFYLNKLPSDYISYWDLDFTDGSDEPRDSSAAAITTCGFLEMSKYLPDGEPKVFFKNAADAQMNALIDLCENHDDDKDGLILHVTHALPQKQGIDECAIYGDYFYMEALSRYLDADFERFW